MPQLSSLNGFNAAYLFLVLALVMMVFFLIWKRGVFAYLSAFGWAAMAVYAFNQANDDATIIMLGTFCLLCLVVSIMLPILFRPKKELPPVKGTMSTDEYVSQLRAYRYGRLPGYDENGRKVPTNGW
jgi:hypothetical protein